MMTSTHLDAIILGGGPAGSAAAIELASAGRRVIVIERSLAAHDKICGDFLSTETLSSLNLLGLDLSALPSGASPVPIRRVSLAGSLGLSSADLPFAAQSLTRRTLDEALLRRAAAAGALVLRGHSAESLHRSDNLWRVSVTGPSHTGFPASSFAGAAYTYTLTAPHLLLATGKHDLRGLPRPTAGTQSDLVGLKMYLRLAPSQLAELRDTIELFLNPGGYGGLSLVEKPSDISAAHTRGRSISPEAESQASSSGPWTLDPGPSPTASNPANLCFVIQRNLLRTLDPATGRGWDALSAFLTQTPHLRTRLEGAEPLLPRPLAISPIPYGFLLRNAIAENLWALGDQAAVIPSFTGDGLALALHSGRFAAQTLLASRTAHHFHAELHAQLRRQLSLSTLLSRALVSRPQRSAIELTARLFPSVLRAVASHTRIAPKYHITRLPKNTCAPA